MKMTVQTIATACRRASEQKKRLEVTDDDCRGLNLGISPLGVCTWSLRVRDLTGRLRRFPLGNFTSVNISSARKAARTLRVDVEGGADPIAEKRRARTTGTDLQAGKGSLRAVLDHYEREGNPPKTWHTGSGRKRVDRVFGTLMPKAVASLSAAEIIRTADGYSGSPYAAQNAIRALRPVISWATRRELAPGNLLLLTPGGGVPPRERVLSEVELRQIIPVLAGWPSLHGKAMILMLLTLARRSEVTGLRWSEIDLEKSLWLLPPLRQKTTRKRDRLRPPLSIFLSWRAVALLKKIRPTDYKPQDLVFPSQRGTPLSNWDRVQKSIHTASQTSNWHRHDLRRTGATMLGDMGYDPHVVEAALNHAPISSGGGRYNQSRYAKQVREAFDKLSRKLLKLTRTIIKTVDERGEDDFEILDVI